MYRLSGCNDGSGIAGNERSCLGEGLLPELRIVRSQIETLDHAPTFLRTEAHAEFPEDIALQIDGKQGAIAPLGQYDEAPEEAVFVVDGGFSQAEQHPAISTERTGLATGGEAYVAEPGEIARTGRRFPHSYSIASKDAGDKSLSALFSHCAPRGLFSIVARISRPWGGKPADKEENDAGRQ